MATGRDSASFAARWPRAQAFGWRLVVHDIADPDHVSVQAPSHFPCQRHQWASNLRSIQWGADVVTVPEYFWDDHVLRTGTTASR